jgi:hypothetical protein
MYSLPFLRKVVAQNALMPIPASAFLNSDILARLPENTEMRLHLILKATLYKDRPTVLCGIALTAAFCFAESHSKSK